MDFFMSGEIQGDIDEIYRKIRNDIEEKLKPLRNKDYGSELTSISFIPIIVTTELEVAGFFKERKLFKRKEKDADYRLRIDYKKFINSDSDTQKLLVIKNIIDCVRSLGEKAKKDFDSLSLERDILKLLDIDEMLFI